MRKLRFGICLLSLEAFLRRNDLSGLPHVNPGSADFGGRPALCEPRSADFVAGVALYEPRSADFVAGVALYEPRCRFRGRHAQHFVSLEVQIS